MKSNSSALEPKRFRDLLVLFFIYTALGLAGIFRHEFWSDEIQAWNLARASHSLAELIQNLRYEGHPPTWYFILQAIQFFGGSIYAMKLAHLAIASLAVWLFLRYSPFPQWQKILFIFSYFPMYEYAVISRSYGLSMLFLFLAAVLFSTRYQRPGRLFLSLILLSCTNLMGCILASAVSVWIGGEMFIRRERWPKKAWLGAVLGLSLFIVCSYILYNVVLTRPPDAEIKNWVRLINPLRGFRSLSQCFFPPYWGWENPMGLWDKYAARSHTAPPMIIIPNLFFLACFLYFKRRPQFLLLFILGVLPILAFMTMAMYIEPRHAGHIFIYFVACAWMLHQEENKGAFPGDAVPQNLSRRRNWIFGVILTFQLISGVYALGRDLAWPFSAVQFAARDIRENKWDRWIVAAESEMIGVPLAAYLDRAVYFSRTESFGTFLKWDLNYRRNIKQERTILLCFDLARKKNQDVLLVMNYRINSKLLKNLEIESLSDFKISLLNYQSCFLYRIKSPASSYLAPIAWRSDHQLNAAKLIGSPS